MVATETRPIPTTTDHTPSYWGPKNYKESHEITPSPKHQSPATTKVGRGFGGVHHSGCCHRISYLRWGLSCLPRGLYRHGAIYFRGSLEAKVQEVSRGIVDEISRTISTTAVEIKGPITLLGSDWKAYCIAGIKYSFLEGKQLDRNLPASTVKVDRAFVKSIVKETIGMVEVPTGSCTSTNDPRPPSSGEGIELLDYRMRVQEFSIESYGRLHVIKLNLFYGGDPDIPPRENEVFEFSLERYPNPLTPFDENNSDHLEFTDETRCELAETFCFISRSRREAYQVISE